MGGVPERNRESPRERLEGRIRRGHLVGLDPSDPDLLYLRAPGEKGTRSGRCWGTSPHQGWKEKGLRKRQKGG